MSTLPLTFRVTQADELNPHCKSDTRHLNYRHKLSQKFMFPFMFLLQSKILYSPVMFVDCRGCKDINRINTLSNLFLPIAIQITIKIFYDIYPLIGPKHKSDLSYSPYKWYTLRT